uniref:Uncharacterized protein n=1 Tax=Marseillevirus sp. TaxID=2809551 RepID=A0AA96EP35_9VIRU|nr:hypothetical protein MarFTMF_107 [Marseillevirus sp.]
MSKTRLVHNVHFSEIGETCSSVRKNTLAFLVETGNDRILVNIPAELSGGKVKYPVCSKCGTCVVWSYGHCRCKSLKETKSGHYSVNDEYVFEHKTWNA